MDWIASLFSSSGVSFRSGAVATKMAEGQSAGSPLRYNNPKGKSGNKSPMVDPSSFLLPGTPR